jgi:predicted SAM-dependent methyltransferase
MCNPDWLHLGEGPINTKAEIAEQFKFGCYRTGIRLWLAAHYRRMKPRYTPAELEKLYASCEFREFFFQVGNRLDFADGEVSFIVSEHFFEHLFLDDAVALLKECRRILKPGGVIRTCVPDADLRTYAKPESPCFPSPKVPWTHHQKHKNRWSIHNFSEVLRLAGLTPRGVVYCNKEGEFRQEIPASPFDGYALEETRPLVGTTAYLRRLPSLIVDGIKPLEAG